MPDDCPICHEALIITEWPGGLGEILECPKKHYRSTRDFLHDQNATDWVHERGDHAAQ